MYFSIITHKDRRCLQEEELALHVFITTQAVTKGESISQLVYVQSGATGLTAPAERAENSSAAEEHGRKAIDWGSVGVSCQIFQKTFNAQDCCLGTSSLSMDTLQPLHQNHRKWRVAG